MGNERMYDLYLEQLREAMVADENAAAALRGGKVEQAIQLYNQAASLYARAAQSLMDAGEGCDAQEYLEIEKSVDRLISISRELRE